MRASTRLSGWRRIASAMWRAPDDPQIFGSLELDAGPLLAFIARARAAGVHLTATHLVGRAVAHILSEVPELNVRIRRGRARARPSIDVFFITAVAKGHDLSGVAIANADAKPAVAIARELAERSTAMKQGHDRDLSRTKQLLDHTPHWLLRGVLKMKAFRAYLAAPARFEPALAVAPRVAEVERAQIAPGDSLPPQNLREI